MSAATRTMQQQLNAVPPHRRGPIAAEYSSPGPSYRLPGLTGVAQHDLSSRHRKQPAFSFGARTPLALRDASPGPCYNPPAALTRCGRNGAPSFSLHHRSAALAQFNVPGPGAYSLHQRHLASPPKFSFGQRQARRKVDATPAPNRYSLPEVFNRTTQSQMKQAAQFSMGPRLRGTSASNVKNPGPGTYSVVNVDNYEKRAPAFTMRGDRKDQMVSGQAAAIPGPGKYLQMKVPANSKASPLYSFGVRHSPFITPPLFDLE